MQNPHDITDDSLVIPADELWQGGMVIMLDICLSEFQVYHFGCMFCFIWAHLLLTEYN